MEPLEWSEEYFRLLVECVPCVAWMARPDGFVEYLNPSGAAYAGLRSGKVCGWGWKRLIHPEDKWRISEGWDRAGRSGDLYDAEYRIRRRDGKYRWQQVRALPSRNPDGTIEQWAGTCTDIEDQKAVEMALQQANEQLVDQAAMLKLSQVLVRDMDSRIVQWSLGAQRLYGWSSHEAVGRISHELFQTEFPESRQQVEETLLRTGRWEGELRQVNRAGERVMVASRWMLQRDAAGRPTRVLEADTDVTERTQAQERLRELGAIVESSDDAIIGKTLEGIITSWNLAAARMYGYTERETVGQSISLLVPPDRRDEVPRLLQALAKGEPIRHYETVRRRKDGQDLHVSLTISPIRNGRGWVVGASTIARDITERDRTQEHLRALAARLQSAREQEAIRIARELHDQLGRCLTTIKMDAILMERELARNVTSESAGVLREKTLRVAQAVDETVRTLRRLCTELRPGILDDLGLAAAIEWQAKDFQERSGVSCVLTLPDEDLHVSRDQATALFRIFQEILTNVARHANATKAWVHLAEEGGEVVLEVEDDGVGVSPRQLGHVRTLGLLGMRERVAVFGGSVEFSGAPGQGAVVIARMPLAGTPP